MISFLACGPYFAPDGVVASIITLAVLKPFAYYGFIQAFRYRVSRAVPMTVEQAAKLALLRAGIGAAIVAAGAALLSLMGESFLQASWLFLYAERIGVWWWLGAWGAGLQGKRLAAWVTFGTLMNAAFDFSLVLGLLTGFIGPLIVAGVVAGFILFLNATGRRDELLQRFSTDPLCHQCHYNLTGNLSGICPECGTPVSESVAARVNQAPPIT